jgi:methylenetetrahydrofolate reductase (NADPH)
MEVGAACYPERHPESQGDEDDIKWTAHKVEVGASFLISQLFFDNERYFEYVDRMRAEGVKVPIVPGIMPITNVSQIERFTKMCGATIPEELHERLNAVQDDPAIVMAAGIEHAIKQCRELLERGAPGLHFYTLNKSHATRSILAALR